VRGVTDSNLATVNAYIATATSDNTDTTADIQVVVDAVNALMAGADGNAANNNVSLTAEQYQLLGANNINSAGEAGLLNDVVDGKTSSDVDSPSKLAALANTVSDIFATAAGEAPASVLTVDRLAALGLTGVTAENLNAILAAIAATATDGSGVDTLAELQAVIAAGISTYEDAVRVMPVG
jgi:hypothetical protein